MTAAIAVAGIIIAAAIVTAHSLVTAEIRAWLPYVAHWLIRSAARALPKAERERYEEEWIAELAAWDDRPLSAIAKAAHIRWNTREMRVSLGDVRLTRAVRLRRVLDIVLCLLAAPLLLIFGGLIAICVFLDSPGPVMYRSRRLGLEGRAFPLLRFRTVRHGAVGTPSACFDDARFTPFGRALALSRLNELPQILNVLRGDMALVGPRPELEAFVEAYPDAYLEILKVRPGLTGPTQLRYSAAEPVLADSENRVARDTESILAERLGIDMEYVQTASLRRDLKLLGGTLLVPTRLGARAYRAWRARRHP